jgi:hypothetical protein
MMVNDNRKSFSCKNNVLSEYPCHSEKIARNRQAVMENE